MKKRMWNLLAALGLILCTILCGCDLSIAVDAGDYELRYEPPYNQKDKPAEEYYLTKYTGNEAHFTIPLEYDGVPIVGIGMGPIHSFKVSNSLKKLSIQKNIRELYESFSGYLEEIEVAEENEYFKSIDGVLFSKDGTKLLIYPPEKKARSYVVPTSVVQGEVGSVQMKKLYIPSEDFVQIDIPFYPDVNDPQVLHPEVFVPEALLEQYRNYHHHYPNAKFLPLPENWEEVVRLENQE